MDDRAPETPVPPESEPGRPDPSPPEAPGESSSAGDAPPGASWVGRSADEAIPELLDLYGARLYALGRRLCRSTADAEDLVQETFLAAYRAWDRFEGRAQPSTWLYTIAGRVCQRLHRKRAGEPEHVVSLEALLPFDEGGIPAPDLEADSPVGEQLRREGRERLETAIASLPLDVRLPLVLKEILGLPLATIAEVLDVAEGTVKSRLHRARLRLRQAVLAGVPTVDAPAPEYEQQVCLDLLDRKQDALDRGVPFAIEGIVCERCRAVFRSLDFTEDLCRRLGAGEALPGEVRAAVLERIRAA